MESAKQAYVLGVMSGTSLDGLDLALCAFETPGNKTLPDIVKAQTMPYSKEWKKRLSEAHLLSAEDYFKLHHSYGKFIGENINTFLSDNTLRPNYIASHGHTVFHQPQNGFTTQIGCGATIAATTGVSTVCDFRSLDVALNGQGAPLVPIGDALLFAEYDACLNLGGIANISFDKAGERIAFDVCFVNMALNDLVVPLGLEYDKDGTLARSGNVHMALLGQLNDCLKRAEGKSFSLGREQYESIIKPVLDKSDLPIVDKLATLVHYVVKAIWEVVQQHQLKKCLVTGGGAHHAFLMEQLQKANPATAIVIPDKQIVDFKEALIFAFLGYLRVNECVNTLKSVTGAVKDSIGGAVYLM
jgi:anhydro-N-acetylmuramic acid kinase